MLDFYSSERFFLSATGAVVVYRLLGNQLTAWLRQLVLVALSIYFLSLLAPLQKIWPFLAAYLAGVVAIGLLLDRAADKLKTGIVAAGCCAAVGILVFYKYGGAMARLGLFSAVPPYLAGIEWLGLSYLTFKVIDYFATRHATPTEPAAEPQRGDWPFLLSYLLFFPAYVSGPINRFQGYVASQRRPLTRMTFERLRANLLRASLGIVKVLLVGNWAFANSILGDAFRSLPSPTWLSVALALYGYYLFFYFNFSGYCDIAIALADFFEVHLPENFNYPFLASSPQEFWNRWHISLSVWVRDFVFFRIFWFLGKHASFIPHFLAMMVSSFISLALVGAWHGDSLNWLLYGCYHGTALCLHLLYRQVLETWFPSLMDRLDESRFYRVVCIILTFNYAAWGLLLTMPLDRLGLLLKSLVGH